MNLILLVLLYILHDNFLLFESYELVLQKDLPNK